MTATLISRAGWPEVRIGEAFEELVRHSRGVPRRAGTGQPLGLPRKGEALNRWFSRAAAALGVGVEPMGPSYHELDEAIASGGPAVVRTKTADGPKYLVVLGAARRGRVRLLTPELEVYKAPTEEVRAALGAPAEMPVATRVDSLLDEVGVRGRHRARARRSLFEHMLTGVESGTWWIVRGSAGAPFRSQLAHAGLLGRAVAVVVAHAAQYLALLGAWWLMGKGALDGHVEAGWLWAWALLLLTIVPLRAFSTWQQGRFVVSTGGLLKRRLLRGLLHLDPSSLRRQGAGQLLGRVIESSAVEALSLGGGTIAILATLEIVVTLVVLCLGAGGPLHAALFGACVVLAVATAWRMLHAREQWTGRRLELTHDLVERMVGHRTRLAQLPREQMHEGEDEVLQACLETARSMDRLGPVVAALPSAWRLIGLAGLAAPFVSGAASAGHLAVALGGILLGSQALSRLCNGLNWIIGARIGWTGVAPVFHAGAEQAAAPGEVPAPGPADDRQATLHAHDLSFRHAGRERATLSGLSLKIASGERLLLGGASGAGKSTLASLLGGIRRQQAGLLLYCGRDIQTLGERQWRSLVALAPQFHENHILTETLAFNLLMGRRWPPTAADLLEAHEVCRELGLGELIERMPSGMMQMVGDTAWQLSHGERSRVFLARALLQGADLVVLDESFGALDPDNLRVAVDCARDRANTLVAIAHP